MPGVSIFLDVDDLESIDALEEYIDGSQAVLGVRLLVERDSQKPTISYVQLMWRSQVIMIFVSQGYFKSGNCLREARASVAKSKPLSLVYDPVRGGAPLQTIREEECPAEMRGGIFDGRSVIEWHRIKDFQLVSLKLLAAEILFACPGYKKQYDGVKEHPEGEQPAAAGVSGKRKLYKQEFCKSLMQDIYVPGEITWLG